MSHAVKEDSVTDPGSRFDVDPSCAARAASDAAGTNTQATGARPAFDTPGGFRLNPTARAVTRFAETRVRSFATQ